LKDLVRLFYVNGPEQKSKQDKKHDLIVVYEQTKTGESTTEITLDSLAVSLRLRPLLKLSKLASLDDSTKAPIPKMPVPIDRIKPFNS
jgi:hypothetical protein